MAARMALLSVGLLAGCVVAPVAYDRPPSLEATAEAADDTARPPPVSGVQEAPITARAVSAFPTRVFTRDAVVTIHAPEFHDPSDEAPVYQAALDVYLDRERAQFEGTAWIPAGAFARAEAPAAMVYRADRIRLEFPGQRDPVASSLRAAARFALDRRFDLQRPDLAGRVSRARHIVPGFTRDARITRRVDSPVALERARLREAERRTARELEYRRLTTEPELAPQFPATGYRHHRQLRPINRAVRPLRGPGRGGFGRR